MSFSMPFHGFILFQPIPDRLVQAAVFAQVIHPVRVGQNTRVKDEIHILWDTALECERFQHNGHRVVFIPRTLPDLAPKLVDVGVRCVDNPIGFLRKPSSRSFSRSIAWGRACWSW